MGSRSGSRGRGDASLLQRAQTGAEAFAARDDEGIDPMAVQFETAELADFLAAKTTFELEHARVPVRVDAADVVPAATALLEPLHGPPLEQVGATLFKARLAGSSQEVDGAFTNSGDNKRVKRLAVFPADEDLHLEFGREVLLQAPEFININGGVELFTLHHFAVKREEDVIKFDGRAFDKLVARLLRILEVIAPAGLEPFAQVIDGLGKVHTHGAVDVNARIQNETEPGAGSLAEISGRLALVRIGHKPKQETASFDVFGLKCEQGLAQDFRVKSLAVQTPKRAPADVSNAFAKHRKRDEADLSHRDRLP